MLRHGDYWPGQRRTLPGAERRARIWIQLSCSRTVSLVDHDRAS
jgi:hypothetical protein